MAQIRLLDIAHSYRAAPRSDSDYALHPLDLTWDDGGAYALLGPSGSGKSTLLNILSGLVRPSRGQLLFDGIDVTDRGPRERNIAQVFQFPVIYDTMTVHDNLAFPLRNRRLDAATIRRRVEQVADILDLSGDLGRRASGLTADAKQRISMGRGLVRQDVAAILFDEPLTVIDPALKWQLRRKLKQIHAELGLTMIYVTHDQTEALTFADKVVVMDNGEVLQEGTPQDLFELPNHVFVGHFIGSPGMNLMPCSVEGGDAVVADQRIRLPEAVLRRSRSGEFTLGIRPEFITFRDPGNASPLELEVGEAEQLGGYRLVRGRVGDNKVAVKAPAEGALPSAGPATAWLRRDRICLYSDGRLVA